MFPFLIFFIAILLRESLITHQKTCLKSAKVSEKRQKIAVFAKFCDTIAIKFEGTLLE